MLRRKVLFVLALITLAVEGVVEVRLAQAQDSLPAPFTAADPKSDIAVDQLVYDPCTAECIHITGTAHIRTHSQTNAAGGTHIYSSFSMKDTSAVGVKTGLRYNTSDDSFDEEDTAAFPYEKTEHEKVHYIRQGETAGVVSADNPTGQDDYWEDLLLHGTVNANGVFTADHFDMQSGCN